MSSSDHHMDDVRRHNEDEALLRRFAATRDTAVRDEIATRFMPLARSLALRYRSGGEAVEDLVQVANLGLIKAIDRYEPDRSSGFVAYASPTILGELRHHFRDRSWSVRLPRSLQERSLKIAEVEVEARAELQRPPSVGEVAARAGLEEHEVVEAMQADRARRTTSLDRPRIQDEEESMPIVEMLGTTEPGFERAESEMASERAELRPKERQALHYRFHAGMTQREIGEEIGVSQMQVSRLLRSALGKLLVAVRGDEELDPAVIVAEPVTEPRANRHAA
ncbi:MAG: sigma-70 family RNA polymerase sigma factor [Solirubrobacterales bacterium]|nr:sigma-70 family RNA polymerase sigma factor [Solirubrobacterales bacterium]MCO5327675.1 sigma-70 family RNA polymerase sigma factor [Solirubrobacterales bacterium]